MKTRCVPEDFLRDRMPGVAPRAQPKLCVALTDGGVILRQTSRERHVRWRLCDDLARQLVPVARKDAALHAENSKGQKLGRVRVSVAHKGWVSPEELEWLVRRVQRFLDR